MLGLIRNATLVLAVLAGGTLAGAAPSAANGLAVNVTVGSAGVEFVSDHRRGHRPQAGRGGACNPQQALRKADRLGVNRARLVRVDRRNVIVQGRARGDRVVVRFAQARGCPVIGYR